jgi:hypothetical protein
VNAHANNRTDVSGLAVMINTRLAADARISRAAAFLWFCAGTAIALTLAGSGVSLALLGYSRIITMSAAADVVAHALVSALEHTKLTTTVTGSVSLAEGSELKLASNQKVSFNRDTIVKLAENSSVRILNNFHMPQPSTQQLQLDTKSKSSELPFTNYTIFKGVEFSKGRVVTGWNYDLADTIRPKSQFCYYKQEHDGGVADKYIIAVNNTPERPSGLTTVSFDFDGALKNCIWFSGY